MFNNRQSRRRFRLGNLARLVQLRQSVSNQPPKDLQPVLLQSPPPFQLSSPSTLNRQSSPLPEPKSSQHQSPAFQTQPQPRSILPPPNQFSSPMPSASTPPDPKASPPSLLSLKSKEESPPQTAPQPTSKSPKPKSSPAFQTQPSSLPPPNQFSSPMPSPSTPNPRSPSRVLPEPKTILPKEVQTTLKPPHPASLTPEAKKLQSHPSTLNATLECPSESIDESQFRSLPPSLASQPPPETKTPPSPPSMHKEFQPQLSKPIDEPSFLPTFLPSQPEAKIPRLPPLVLAPPDTKAAEESLSQQPLPSKSLSESGELQQPFSPSLSESSESQLPLPKESQPPPLVASKTIDETQLQESRRLPQVKATDETMSPPKAKIPRSLSESQLHLPPPETKTPSSTLKESQSQPLPPPIENPKSTTPLPGSGQQSKTTINLHSQSSPPLLQTKPNPIESQTSKDHNKVQNQNLDKPDAKLIMKIPAEISGQVKKNKGNLKMFINSNVQGINTSLSLDSSSIDHEPGVHFNHRLS